MREDIIHTGGERREMHDSYCVDKMLKRPAVVVEIPNKRLLNTAEAQVALDVSRATLYRMIKDSDIPAVRVRGTWRIRTKDIENYLDQN